MNLLRTSGMYAAEIDVNTFEYRIIQMGLLGANTLLYKDKSSTLLIAQKVCDEVLTRLEAGEKAPFKLVKEL